MMHPLLCRLHPGAVLASLLLALLVVSSDAVPTRQVRPLALFPPTPPDPRPVLVRGVDDVAPAFKNATATALEKAKAILSRYSTVLRVVAIPTGLAVSFFGYFLLGPVLFLAGFILGGGACFVAVHAALGNSAPAAAWIAIAAMLLGGAMLGFLALRALSLGMFAVGAALGVVLASAVKTTLVAHAYPKDPQLAFYITAAVCGLAFGTLALCLQKQMLIFSTAYAGSCACVFGIGKFAGHFPTTEELTKVEAGKFDRWVLFYVLLTIALGTAGMFFQFWLGRGKAMPTHAPHDRRRRRRRVRQYEPEDWSDEDDWGDDFYVEQAPLPRRKSDPALRPDLQPPLPSTQDSFKGEMPHPRQASYPQGYPNGPWNSVRNAVNVFEDGSAQDSDPVTPAPQPDPYKVPEEVSPAVMLDVEPGPECELELEPVRETGSEREPESKCRPEPERELKGKPGLLPELELKPEPVPEPEFVPQAKISPDEAPETFSLPSSVEALDIADAGLEHGRGNLVSVSLESDGGASTTN